MSPFGYQLRRHTPWYGHEHFGDWPHKGSALSLGESNILKYGVTYPLRTGLDNPDKILLPETIIYLLVPKMGITSSAFDVEVEDDKVFEEIFLSNGICTVSLGPLGGPSRVKAIFRPLDSYGTGGKVKSVVKTEFPQDIKTDDSDLKGERAWFVSL